MSNKPLVPEGFLFDVSVSDLRSPQVLERIARRLIGKTFREIHSQGFNPDGIDRAYNNAAYKGGLGTLVEEYVNTTSRFAMPNYLRLLRRTSRLSKTITGESSVCCARGRPSSSVKA